VLLGLVVVVAVLVGVGFLGMQTVYVVAEL
jgi:hypothetical protein